MKSTAAGEHISIGHECDFQATALRFFRLGKGNCLMVLLKDGRGVVLPLAKFPTLQRAKPRVRDRWRLIGKGEGFRWDSLDLDLSVRGIVLGRGEGNSGGRARSA